MSFAQPLSDELRPKGFLQPLHDRGRRALKAIEDRRLQDAEENIAAFPDCPAIDLAWKRYLGGLLAITRGDLYAATPLFAEVASSLPPPALEVGQEPDRMSLRLAAGALQQLGLIHRRQDRPRAAYRVHLSAYHLRNEHGSLEEVWESALNLGIDTDLEGHYEQGQTWHRIAAETATRATENPAEKQAIAWTYLSASLIQNAKHDEAVEAARTARDWWQRHDLGAVTAARADLKLGYALLKQGEALHDTDSPGARAALEEAVKWLASAGEALEAFGPENAADIRWCGEQRDFAQRLLVSLQG